MQVHQVNSGPQVTSTSSTKQDSQGANAKDAKLKAACQQFEAVFWNQVLDAMQETVPDDGILGDSFSNDIYQSMLNQQYSVILAGQDSSSNGLSEIMYQQLTAIQMPEARSRCPLNGHRSQRHHRSSRLEVRRSNKCKSKHLPSNIELLTSRN